MDGIARLIDSDFGIQIACLVRMALSADLPRPVPPEVSAREAGLHYISDQVPGINRIRTGEEFEYTDSQGRAVRDDATLERIRSVVIPPNWSNVWICSSPKGHLQATGRDAKGRKQYRYHNLYRTAQEETKYEKMILFGGTLPQIRQRNCEIIVMSLDRQIEVIARQNGGRAGNRLRGGSVELSFNQGGQACCGNSVDKVAPSRCRITVSSWHLHFVLDKASFPAETWMAKLYCPPPAI
jgi:DNA topoisomerase IB